MNNYDVKKAEMPTYALISLTYKQWPSEFANWAALKTLTLYKHSFCVKSTIREYSIHIGTERCARSLYPTGLLV